MNSVVSDASSHPALIRVGFVSEKVEKNRMPLGIQGLRTAEGDKIG
jgi:hypothetical protein